jgi:hypothetical protein
VDFPRKVKIKNEFVQMKAEPGLLKEFVDFVDGANTDK